MSVFICCEAGSCHEGKLINAQRLVNLACAAGADAVKFQLCSNYDKLGEKRKTVIEYPFSIQLDWIPYLHEYCGERIEFMVSTYLTEDVKVVAPWVKRFKIASYECNDEEFVHENLLYDKPVLRSGYNVYCVAKYPCPDNEAHLWDLITHMGFSDHTQNPLSGAIAVARGAEYIETHIKLNDTTDKCPDFAVARSPEEVHTYIQNIRQAEILLG